ncbi:MAG: hypothetical protein QF450_04640 [Rhodospirillales bacterium]|nr:hypothetical protein [Rhodospirillales bacterium]
MKIRGRITLNGYYGLSTGGDAMKDDEAPVDKPGVLFWTGEQILDWYKGATGRQQA